mgnify:FL=1
MYYVVKYTGKFGFIKPWTAVRDGLTYSQQFLSPSTLEGIEKKLFPETLTQNGVISKIKRYRLSYSSIDVQQEQTQTRGFNGKKKIREKAVLNRGIMIDPILYLAFADYDEALKASKQHVCLCRNEDILLPDSMIEEMDESSFNSIKGFEMRFGKSEQSFMVGYNRFDNTPMYGWLEIDGQSIL